MEGYVKVSDSGVGADGWIEYIKQRRHAKRECEICNTTTVKTMAEQRHHRSIHYLHYQSHLRLGGLEDLSRFCLES